MAQRLRALRGATALLHQAAESASGAGSLLPSCSSATSLLQQLQTSQQQRWSGGSWQQQAQWGSSLDARHLSWFSRKPAASAPTPVSLDSGDGDTATTSTDAAPPVEPEFWPLPESSAMDVVDAIHQATGALEKASIMAAKSDAFFAASWCIGGLQMAHEALGTPWWLSIAAFNITLRILTFPLMVMGQKGSAKMMEFNYNLLHAKKLQEAAMKATTQEEHNRLYQAFRSEYTAQTSKHGDPVKTAMVVPGVMLFNGFIFISIFNGISKLMAAKVPSLTVGGAAWFTDLTAPDPYFGLPIMCTAVTLMMVEYGINLAGDAPMPTDRKNVTTGLKWMLRGLAFMFIPAGNYVAAGTAVLWVSNTAFGVVQGLVLRNDTFRRRVGLPTMQAIRDMNAKVMEANAAAAPNPAGMPSANPFATRSDDPAPAVATPLLKQGPQQPIRK